MDTLNLFGTSKTFDPGEARREQAREEEVRAALELAGEALPPPPPRRIVAYAQLPLWGLTVSHPTLWKMIKEDEFPSPIRVRGMLYWIEEELKAWRDSRPRLKDRQPHRGRPKKVKEAV